MPQRAPSLYMYVYIYIHTYIHTYLHSLRSRDSGSHVDLNTDFKAFCVQQVGRIDVDRLAMKEHILRTGLVTVIHLKPYLIPEPQTKHLNHCRKSGYG